MWVSTVGAMAVHVAPFQIHSTLEMGVFMEVVPLHYVNVSNIEHWHK